MKTSAIVKILRVIGYFLYAAGLVAGVFLAATRSTIVTFRSDNVRWVMAAAQLAAGFISGSSFLGFAEIIALLGKLAGRGDSALGGNTQVARVGEAVETQDLPEL